MPRPIRGRTLGSLQGLRRRIVYERTRLGMKPAGLAWRMTKDGCPIHQSTIWKIENADRGVSVEELIAFSHVFDVSVQDLLLPVDAVLDREVAELYRELDALGDTQMKVNQTRRAALDRLYDLAKRDNHIDRVLEGSRVQEVTARLLQESREQTAILEELMGGFDQILADVYESAMNDLEGNSGK